MTVKATARRYSSLQDPMNSSGNARRRMEIASQGQGNGKVAPLILAGWLCHKITPPEMHVCGRAQRSQEGLERYMVIAGLLELQQNP